MMKKKGQIKVSEESFKKKVFSQGLPVFHEHAAGIDIGDTMHAVAISNGKGGHEVREYPTFTENLKDLVAWLVSVGITTAGMESTGVYWLTLYLMLEEAGIEPYLVNAKYAKNVSGRKKDDTDAIWLQKLHSCGLLQKSFQPESEMRVLRTYVRHRNNLISISSDSVRRMQKAMELMNLKLHTVISDILGKTGLQMVNAILNGEHDPNELVKLKDHRIKASEEDIKKSLVGIWKEEYLFMLKQAYEQYVFYQSQIGSCEELIMGQLLKQAAKILDGDITGLQPKKNPKKKPKKNQFNNIIRPLLTIIAGVDLCAVSGISEVSSLNIISEMGNDMGQWFSAKHAAAWLNLVPNTKITGGKIISSKMQKKKNRAGQAFRMSASSLIHCKSPLGDYARKMRSRLGKKGGVVATAHKLAITVFTMIKYKCPYNPEMMANSQLTWKEKRIKSLEKQLSQLKCVV
jgi:transposase